MREQQKLARENDWKADLQAQIDAEASLYQLAPPVRRRQPNVCIGHGLGAGNSQSGDRRDQVKVYVV